MSNIQTAHQEKTVEFLRRVVPQDIIDHGISLAAKSSVHEFYKDGAKIRGYVKDTEEESQSVCLYVIAPTQIEPSCTCVKHGTEWCAHSVALLWAAQDLGIFDAGAGFDDNQNITRFYASTPQEISLTIKEIVSGGLLTSTAETKASLEVFLKVQNEGLALQPKIDGEIFIPSTFERGWLASSRTLDTLFLEKISHDGIWDEENKLWLINGSRSIDIVLGLLREYENVNWLSDKKSKSGKVKFSPDVINAILNITWEESAVEVAMEWDIKEKDAEVEIIGTGPHWAKIGSTIHKLSATASRIVALFPHSNSLSFSKGRAGPFVELLGVDAKLGEFIKIANRDLMPVSKVADPKIKVDLRSNSPSYAGGSLDIIAIIDFEYPESSANGDTVYLPNRLKEQDAVEILSQVGFDFDPATRRFRISGDRALDLIEAGPTIFPTAWETVGLTEIKKNLKFTSLALNVSVSQPDENQTDWSSDGVDWFDCHVALTQNNANIPLSAIFKNQNNNSDRWVQLDGGAYARVPGNSLAQLKTVLGTVSSSFWMSNSIRANLSPAQAVSLSGLDKDTSIRVKASTEFTNLLKKVENFKEIESLPIPKKFKGKLRPYQKEGFYWLNFLGEFGFGGILADEMGLGKTVQTLTFLQYLKDQGNKKPSLIVVPTSIITNWLYEARKFTPELKVLVLHGPQRKDLYKQIPEHDLIVTSYALLRLDYRELEKNSYNYFILDEAQNIKNEQAATTKAAKNIRSHRRLALTGTPTENRPMELWSIMDFLMPGYLGTADFFKKNFEKPILDGPNGQKAATYLRNRVRPFILKRKKNEVEKDLPPKLESVVHVEMTPPQQALYMELLSEIRPQVFGEIEEKGIRGASICILAALLRLRQICNHPKSIEAFKDFEELTSGKFNALQELILEALESNRKILLYSQFVSMLTIMRSWLDEQKIGYLYLDGRTKDRQDLVDKFNNDDKERLFLISLKAGGTGLNLTGADTVIIYDPWWNPAVEDQAADRAHRIGQKKAVTVYRMVTENSVERRIMDLKEKKAKLVDALLNDRGVSPLKLSKDDIESLFAPPVTFER